MEIGEIRETTEEELKDKIREFNRRIFDLRIALRQSNASLREYRELRKTLARILTVQRERDVERSSAQKQGEKR
jgi:large subunit ribosomal protein L29